jgi:DNA-binding response OmpR family regulator
MRKPFHFDELLARVRTRLRARAELDRLGRIVDELQMPGVGETEPVRPERNASA